MSPPPPPSPSRWTQCGSTISRRSHATPAATARNKAKAKTAHHAGSMAGLPRCLPRPDPRKKRSRGEGCSPSLFVPGQPADVPIETANHGLPLFFWRRRRRQKRLRLRLRLLLLLLSRWRRRRRRRQKQLRLLLLLTRWRAAALAPRLQNVSNDFFFPSIHILQFVLVMLKSVFIVMAAIYIYDFIGIIGVFCMHQFLQAFLFQS